MTIQNLKTYMKQNGISYAALSEKSGVPLNTLKKVFSGQTDNPRIDTVRAIERALGLAPTFTDEERALGVGNHPIALTDRESIWISVLHRADEVLGEEYTDTVVGMVNAAVENKQKA